jgi:hypothetical protein
MKSTRDRLSEVSAALGEMAGRIRLLERESQRAQYTDTDAVWSTFEECLALIRKACRALDKVKGTK